MEFKNRTKIPTNLETPLMKDVKKLLLENNIEKAIIPRLSEDFQDFSQGMYLGEIRTKKLSSLCNKLNLLIADYFLKPEDKLDETWYYCYHIPQHVVICIPDVEEYTEEEHYELFMEDFTREVMEVLYYKGDYYISNVWYNEYIKTIEEKRRD